MTRWRDFEYLVFSAPYECAFDLRDPSILLRTDLSPRHDWIVMANADALLIVMDDAEGLLPNGDHVFQFDGDRFHFDQWMSAHHSDVPYLWVDQLVVAFPDRAAQQSFDDDLGERLLRSTHLPRTVCSTVMAPSP
jgi:hypothetical protein